MKFQSKLVVFLITCVCSDARISSSKHGHEEKGISQDDRSRKLVSYLEAHVLCGSGSSSCAGGVPKIVDANDENEKYDVRCCYDSSSSYKESNSSTFQKRSACDVWTDSSIPDCQSSKTFTEAVDLCDTDGGRLCTSNEIASNCAETSGCGFDNRLVWTSPAPPPMEAQVLCGRDFDSSSCAGGVPKIVDTNDENEKYAVRCCYDYSSSYKESSSSFLKNSGCDVWTDSKISECRASENFTEAVALCDSDGGRLCTSNEIASNCAKGSGCAFDHHLVWTSPTGPLTNVLCGDGSSSCDKGANAWWQKVFPKIVVANDENEKYAVRCCYDSAITGDNVQKNPGCDVWSHSYISSQCHASKTFTEAVDLCDSDGGRLCTSNEIASNCAGGSGCAFDDDLVWASRDYWSTDFNKQWLAVDIPKTFADAEAHCETIGAKLAAPQNENENRFMQSEFPTKSIWFGYRCAEADCTEVSTWNLPYENFNSGQPNCNECGSAISGVGVCTGSHSKSAATWNDNGCGELKRFLCQQVYSLAIAEVREWTTVEGLNKQWLAVDIPKTFADAEAYCETIGATLAAPENSVENKFMQSEFRNKEIWFGYKCAATDCSSASKWNIPYENFEFALPKCSGCGSAMIGSAVCAGSHLKGKATWNDNDCGELKRFLCQK